MDDAEIMSLLGFSDKKEILETHKCKKSLESLLTDNYRDVLGHDAYFPVPDINRT